MHWSHGQTPSSGDATITFPKLECWNPMTRVASFAAEVNKKRVLCRISAELLTERFEASIDEPMRAVVKHRAILQEAARTLIERESYEEDGSVLIRSQDLP